VANSDFATGEINAIEKDHPILRTGWNGFESSWKVDNGTAPAYTTFGKYSVNKHQFYDRYVPEKRRSMKRGIRAITLAQAPNRITRTCSAICISCVPMPTLPISGSGEGAPCAKTSDPYQPGLVSFPN